MEKVLWALGVSAGIVLLLGPLVIPALTRLKFGQNIRDDGPQRHLQKAGTPTMGGLMILGGIIFATLLLGRVTPEILVLLGVTIGYGVLGFLDDFIKVVMKRSLGLRAKHKLAGQIIIAAVMAYLASFTLGLGSDLIIPFTGIKIELGWWAYLGFVILLMVSISNAVNLTDGLDGLAAGITVVTSLAFTLIAIMVGEMEVALFAAAVAGSCLGFLFFNAHPARVFMGDTGSLALGGALGAITILTKTELLLPIIGGVFVAENLSVVIQVISFKLTGKRVFRMSPLHHHFELGGWSEKRVVRTFWLAAVVCSIIGLFGMRGIGN
ncbi:MAG: phospho-N-acetylmuramoyl-pentapeptide-transferase [Clostridia bacterium]|nr:phospho-N-acetylmuramoyl-pentapeptide-transferase [Clostridia bacterium]